MPFVERLVKKYGNNGKLDRLWLMDRGVPTEETLTKMRTVLKVLHAIDVRIVRRRELDKDGRPVEKEHKALSRDELVSRLAVAKSKAGRSWCLFRIRKPKATETTVT